MRYMMLLIALTASSSLLAQAATAPEAKPALGKDDKVVCHTWAPVGSLIPTKKECRTKRDWENLRVNTTGVSTLGSCSSAETGRCN